MHKHRKPSAIQEIGCHQQLQSNLRGNRELWNLSTAVGVSHFVHEIGADFSQHM